MIHENGYYWILRHGQQWEVAVWYNNGGGDGGGRFKTFYNGEFLPYQLENINWSKIRII